jgi:hypothetical protein
MIQMEIKLIKRIERLRKKLIRIGMNKNLVDPEVVEISQQLDILLNRYYEIRQYEQLSFW